MALWFWSDPHFGHKNVIKYCNRPFSSVEEMNLKLIENYNSVVGPKDLCVWVGDCFFTSKTRAKEILSQLNGNKCLIRGNHDGSNTKMLDLGFLPVTNEMWIRQGNTEILVKHYPFAPKEEVKYKGRMPEDTGKKFLIHGHTHQKDTFRGRAIHVGVDSNNFTPISWETIASYIERNNHLVLDSSQKVD